MKSTVLLIDDEPAIQFGLGRYLVQRGFAVESASCLFEGREKLKRDSFDALILDLALPDGNGLDWIAVLKRNYPKMAIVVVSGSQDPEIGTEAINQGADYFYLKPVDLDALHGYLKRSVQHSVDELQVLSHLFRARAGEETGVDSPNAPHPKQDSFGTPNHEVSKDTTKQTELRHRVKRI